MGENELRAVGESIKVGDKIRIGILDTDLTVEDRPIEESGGSLIFSASRPNYPEEGIVTSVMFSLGPQSNSVQITKFIMEEKADDSLTGPDDYDIGEEIELKIHSLQELTLVE